MQTTSYRSGNSLILNLHFRFEVKGGKGGMCVRQEIYKIYVFVNGGRGTKDPLHLKKNGSVVHSELWTSHLCFQKRACDKRKMLRSWRNKSAIFECLMKRWVGMSLVCINYKPLVPLFFLTDTSFMACYVCFECKKNGNTVARKDLQLHLRLHMFYTMRREPNPVFAI